jgi:hypothetical protein
MMKIILLAILILCDSSQIQLSSLNKIQKQKLFDRIETSIWISMCLSKNAGIYYMNITNN